MRFEKSRFRYYERDMLDSIEDPENEREFIFRKCPICEEVLSYSDFIRENYNKNVDLSKNGAWYDKRLAIPCCKCLAIIDKLQKAKDIEYFYNSINNYYHFRIISNSMFEEPYIITVFKKEIVKNLYKYGIIDWKIKKSDN